MYLPAAEVCAQKQSHLYKSLHIYEWWLDGERASQWEESHNIVLTRCMINKTFKNNFTHILPRIYIMALHVNNPVHVNLITSCSKQETNVLNAYPQFVWLYTYK